MSEKTDKEFVDACTKFRAKFTTNAEEFDALVVAMFKEATEQNEALMAQVAELREGLTNLCEQLSEEIQQRQEKTGRRQIGKEGALRRVERLILLFDKRPNKYPATK